MCDIIVLSIFVIIHLCYLCSLCRYLWQEAGVMLPRFPEAETGLENSVTAFQSGLRVEWTTITSFGGEFRMCWCPGSGSRLDNSTECQFTSNFVVDFGRFNLIGFHGLGERTCVAGQNCILKPFLASDEGDVLVLETCGHPGIGFLLDNNENNETLTPTAPGNYRLCWCFAPCATGATLTTSFDVGEFLILGPRAGQDRTCVSGRECHADGIEGIGLSAFDRWFVLETCGIQTRTRERMAHAGQISSVTRSGSSVSFGSTLITAGGGVFRLCWCASGFTCSTTEHYRVDVGELLLVGPAITQSRSCMSGQSCAFHAPPGKMLSTADSYLVLETCGVAGSLVKGLPDGGMLSISAGNATSCDVNCELTFGTTTVTAPGGSYQLCWCFASQNCIREEDFVVTVGDFELIGPQTLFDKTCIAGQSCVVDIGVQSALSWSDANDTLAILETCGVSRLAYVAFAVALDRESLHFAFDMITAAGGKGLRRRKVMKSVRCIKPEHQCEHNMKTCTRIYKQNIPGLPYTE